ncbi:MAG: DUF6518 family protein [Ilumatobacteraceae bacterium]
MDLLQPAHAHQPLQTSPAPPAPREASSTSRKPSIVVALASLALALAAGAAIGIGTQVLQGVLPGAWGVLANSGVMWALGAVLVGLLMPSDRVAVVAGALAMVTASFSYYAAVEWFEHSASNGSGAAMWARAGLLAGPFFAFAGRAVRLGGTRRWLAVAAFAGTLGAEGAQLIWFVGVGHLRVAGIVELVVGAALLAASAARARGRRRLPLLAPAGIAVACAVVTLFVLRTLTSW